MRVLAIDTSGERLSLALGDGASLWEVRGLSRKPHDERLWPELERLLRRAGWRLEELGAVAVCSGPGRFTGIRIGMAFAGVLARSLGRPALAVTAFEALASRLEGGPLGREVRLALPGPPGEFYLQAFTRRGAHLRPSGEPAWLKTADSPGMSLGLPSAADLIAPALRRLAQGKLGPFRPLYLKPANFEKR